MIVALTDADCRCDLITFYKNVARKMNETLSANTNFDCRKIMVTKDIQDAIWEHYKEQGYTDGVIAMTLLCSGPKATLQATGEGSAYVAEIQDGFLTTDSREVSNASD